MLRFDSAALYAALDRQRRARDLTWKQVAPETGVSVATLQCARLGGRLEVDGVLAMVGWLDRSVESSRARRCASSRHKARTAASAAHPLPSRMAYLRIATRVTA